MHFARAAHDGLGRIDLVANGAHWKDLVNELDNEFLPGVSESSHHRCFRRCFSTMRCILAGDIGFVDADSNLAGRDESDRCLRIAGNVEAVSSMCVSSHVDCFHPQ